MAATASVDAKAKEDFVDEFLTCSICTEPYDSNEHQAKCLTCLHTYCKSCLQCYAGTRPKFNCPKCRCLIPLPSGTVDSLPNNFIVENLKEYQGILDRSVSCGNCDDDNPAVRFCHDCGSFQCQRCADNHQIMRSMRHHHLATLEELQGKKCSRMIRQQLCVKHPKQDLTLYCREPDCRVPVCASCGLVDHRGHDLIDLSAAVDEIKEEMHQSSARVTSRNEELVKKKATAETNQAILTDNYRLKEQDLDKLEEKLIASIRRRFTEARSHLQHLYQSEMNRLTSEAESIDLLTSQMTSACEFVDTACDMSHPMQLVTSQIHIMDRLRKLENEEFPEMAQDKTNFDFTQRHHSAFGRINELLPDVGDMDWERENQADEISGNTRDSAKSSRPAVDPSCCTITFHLKARGVSSGPQTLIGVIKTADSNARLIKTSGALVDVKHGIYPLPVCDNGDGSYQFDCVLPGQPDPASQLYITINGTEMNGSPYPTSVLEQSPCEVDPSRCTIDFETLRGYYRAIVQLVDVCGRTVPRHVATVEAVTNQGRQLKVVAVDMTRMTSGKKIKKQAAKKAMKPKAGMTASDPAAGMYSITFLRQSSVHVRVNGDPMRGNPYVP